MIDPDWIGPNRTALILIDCQVDFGSSDGEMARRGADMTAPQAALAKAVTLTDAARAAGVRIVFVRLLTHPGGESKTAREAKARRGDDAPDLCVEGTRGADFMGPQPLAGETFISKTCFSAFTRNSLAEDLGSWGIDTLIICGLTTECCVASSAWAAFEEGFHVFIADDACAAYEEGLHRHALKALEMNGATLAMMSDFVATWENSYKTKT